ncbi:hypothetical protein FBEOM_781 [Fusarium beomiforme]|uniref:Uncharacterized protein n=1 Tax=Fusarium beomiforme TaxID=44412 RepID=A0A9P5AUY6_9HYPO|nr:hypothetical protein FBEOM_781 [Fusarium beomiforme]
MTVFKLKVIASILAFCAASVAATEGESATCLSDHVATDAPSTEHGVTSSGDTVISTMNICTITRVTHCGYVASIMSSAEMQSSVATNMPSVPAGGATGPVNSPSNTYLSAKDFSSSATLVISPAEQTGAQSTGAPVVPAPGASNTQYLSGPGAASGEQGPGFMPSNSAVGENPSPSAIIGTTDASGVLTISTAHASSVTDTTVVTDSETGYETTVSGTATGAYHSSAEETDESTPTGTPGVTASAAAKTLAPGAALGIAGMLIAVLF